MNDVAKLFTSVPEYAALPVPSPLDLEVERVVRAAVRGGVADLRELVGEAIASGTRSAFPVAAYRISSLAKAKHDLDLMKLAIEIYVAFVDRSREDWRDGILAFDRYTAALAQLGEDPPRVLRQLVAYSLDPERHQMIEDYLAR